MSDHDELRDWDAAYVLGSLSPDERRLYERHLADCSECRAALAELAGMPGLLARVPAEEAEAMLDLAPVSVPNLMPRLAGHLAQRRRRRRRLVIAASVGAAAIVLAFGVVIGPGLVDRLGSSEPTSVAVTLQPVVDSPLEASIRLVEEQWGTRIDMECRYGAGSAYSPSADYAMYVTDADGDDVRIATWTAGPGTTAEPSGTTSLALAQISSVDVRSLADGRVLLRGTP